MKSKHIFSIAFLITICITIGANSRILNKSFHKPYKTGSLDHIMPKVKLSSSLSIKEMTKNVEFGFSKADVQEQYLNQLDQLANTIINGKYALALRGHADSIGTYVGNWKLSDKRAIAVKNYLLTKGVPSDKIVTTPFGSTIPIASNKTSEGRKKNRRVEIKLQASNL